MITILSNDLPQQLLGRGLYSRRGIKEEYYVRSNYIERKFCPFAGASS